MKVNERNITRPSVEKHEENGFRFKRITFGRTQKSDFVVRPNLVGNIGGW
jgi:hypothetical protein